MRTTIARYLTLVRRLLPHGRSLARQVSWDESGPPGCPGVTV